MRTIRFGFPGASAPLAAVKCRESGLNQNMQNMESRLRGKDGFSKSIVCQCFQKSHICEGGYEEYGARLHISVSLTITFNLKTKNKK